MTVVSFLRRYVMKYGKALIKKYCKIADELGYPEEVKEKIRKAKTEEEACHIMAEARRKAN